MTVTRIHLAVLVKVIALLLTVAERLPGLLVAEREVVTTRELLVAVQARKFRCEGKVG